MKKGVNRSRIRRYKDDQTSHKVFDFEKTLQIVVSLLTIFGVSIASLSGAFVNHLPSVQRRNAEIAIEKVKVSESQVYIESILGVPQKTTIFEYSTKQKDILQGSKSLFMNDYYILITYYDHSDTCIGYFLVSTDPKFSPELYDSQKLLDKRISDSPIPDLGFRTSIGHFTGNRPDCSSYHIEFYTHHLALNNCYVGLGISDLGTIDQDAVQFLQDSSLPWPIGYISITHSDNYTSDLSSQQFMGLTPNVFSVFWNGSDVDIDGLLNRELQYDLAINHSDLQILK